MNTPKPEISNKYAKLCIQYLEGKLELMRLRSHQKALNLTNEQAEHILNQARNLTGIK